MRTRLGAIAAIIALSTTGCGSIMRFIGDKTADMITQPTSTLADTAVTASFTRNLYPVDANTVESTGVDGWSAGKSWVLVTLLKRHGVGMHQLDGSVVVRKAAGGPEEPLPYLGKGAYGMVLPEGDTAARRIELRPAGGGVATYTVQPTSPVRIKAVNGQKAGATVDLTRDLVVDLTDAGAPNTRLKVALCSTVLGVRTFTDVAVCKPSTHLVIPAAAFRHMAVSASMENFVKVDPGANYVLVERYQVAGPKPKGVGASQVLGRSWATSPVTVTGDVGNATGLTAQGELANPHGKLHYSFYVPPAFTGRAARRYSKIALGSLAVRGQLFKQTSSAETSYGYNAIVTTTTTTTLAFPAVKTSSWDNLLEEVHGDLGGAFGAPLVSALNSPSYAQLQDAPSEASSVFVDRAYKGAPQQAFATDPAKLLADVSSTFASDRPFCRVLGETGADALAAVTLNVQIATRKDSDKLVLIPGLNVIMMGPPNGYTVGPTMYLAGSITAEDGVPIPARGLDNPGALAGVVREADLMSGLQQALGALKKQEHAARYDAIWALQ